MFSKEERVMPVRMTEEDRRIINRMIQDKCAQFESVIQRGVMAMLNTQSERKKLSSEHQDLLGALTSRNQRKKELTTSVANVMKDATSAAPAGMGAAANALITTGNAVGSALYDNAEEKRQEEAAESRLISAQFMHYITSEDYESIAHQVAKILSYRFQLLIFRLAGGEDGYIALAKFFIDSMKTYAIERFREHKGEYIKSLIYAAIPPFTNARRYRAWPSFEPSDFRADIRFGYNKILKQDPLANEIVGRCGPAVRAFIGGYVSFIDPQTSQEKKFSPYTIRGAIHHACILNCRGEMMSSLETGPRHEQVLRGDNKYPMLLLGCNETTADLGVNIATSLAAEIQDVHVCVLHRLVPNFFLYETPYQVLETGNKKELDRPSYDEMKYPEERFEIPWSVTRERLWKERLKQIYTAGQHSLQEANITTISHFGQLTAMRDVGNVFDTTQAKEDAMFAMREAREKCISIHENISREEREDERLNAAVAAKYLAISVRKYLNALIKCESYQNEGILFASKCLEFSRITLSASFDLPLLEMKRNLKLRQSAERIEIEARRIDALQFVSYKNLQRLVSSLGHSPHSEPFLTEIQNIIAVKIKKIKAQLKENIQELENSMKLTQIIVKGASNDAYRSEEVHCDIQFSAFDEAATQLQTFITSNNEANDVQILKNTMALFQMEAHSIWIEIECAFDDEDYVLDHDSFAFAEMSVPSLSLNEKIRIAKQLSKESLEHIALLMGQATQLIERQSVWQRFWHEDELRQSLQALCQEAKVHRDRCATILSNIKPKQMMEEAEISAEINLDMRVLFKKIQRYRRFGLISRMAKKTQDEAIDERFYELQERLSDIYRSNIGAVLCATDTLFREISVEHLDDTDADFLYRHALKVKRMIKLNKTLEQAIDCDLDAMNQLFNQKQWVVNVMNQVKQDKHDLSDSMLSMLDNMSLLSEEELEETSSPKKDGFKAIDQLRALFSELEHALIEGSMDAQMGVLAPEYTYVSDTLNQLIVNTTTTDDYIWITREAIKEQICTYLKMLGESSSREIVASDHWGVWLIAKVTQWITKEMITHETHGIDACHERAKQELTLMKQILSEESADLMHARRAALQEIRLAVIQIKATEEKKLRVTNVACAHALSDATLVANALTWAARGSYDEQRWLDERISIKYRRQFISSDVHRSPMLLLTFLLVAYCSDKIEEKKELLAQLHKLVFLQNKCSALVFKIKNDIVYKEGRKLSIDNETKRLELMDRLIDEKCEIIEKEKADVMFTRENILAQRLRIYFDEWKKKTHDPETVSERSKAIKSSALERASKKDGPLSSKPIQQGRLLLMDRESADPLVTKKSAHTFAAQQLNEVVDNYTIEDIEKTLSSLFSKLQAVQAQMQMNESLPPISSSRYTIYGEKSIAGLSPLSKSTSPSIGKRAISTNTITLNF